MNPVRRFKREVRSWLWSRASQPFAFVKSSERFVVRTNDWAVGRKLFLNGQYDLKKFFRAMALLERQKLSTLYDIGANIGSICIPAVCRGFAEKAVAVEPEPVNYALLVTNASWNSCLDRVDCMQLGLSSGRETAALLIAPDPGNFGDFRVGEKASCQDPRAVRLVRFDDLGLVPTPDADLFWMDVQGHEIEVLRGARKILTTRTPLVMEFWPSLLEKTATIDEFMSLIAGYREFANLGQKMPEWEQAQNLRALWNAMVPNPQAATDILVR